MKITRRSFLQAAGISAAALSFAACGGKDAPANGGSGDGVTTVSVYCMSFNNIPQDSECSRVEKIINDYIAATYPEDKIAIDIRLFGPAEYFQKVQLAMQSGDKIDAYLELALASDVASEMLAPLDDLIAEYATETTALLQHDFDPNPYGATTTQGAVYSVPVNKGMALNISLLWNTEIAEAAGVEAEMEAVTCVEDLTAIFEKVHAYDPTVVCFSPLNQGDSGMLKNVLFCESKIDRLSDTDYFAGVCMGKSSEVVNIYATPEFKAKCDLVYGWNQAGYMQADAATTTSTASELFASGRGFCTVGGYGGESAGAIISASSGHSIKSKIIYDFYFDTNAVGVTFGVASTSKVPEAAMKMINRLWTDKFIINTFLYGEEGVDYVKPDADHWAYPDGKDGSTVGYTAALCTGVIGSESLQYQSVGTDVSDIALKIEHNVRCERSPFYGFIFDPSGVSTEMSAISNVFNQYVPGLICGTVNPDTTIPEFLNALEGAGISTVIAAKQDQLNAWLASK